MGRTKGLSGTQRTLRALRDRGLKCAIVEKFNHHVGRYGIRQDLFGIIDIIALDPVKGVIGIQSTTTAFAQHKRKILEEMYQECLDWLNTPGTSLELWGWRKVKLRPGAKAMRWKPRVGIFKIEGGEIIFVELKE